LAPFVDAPTQRVAMLMAEIERTEHGDSGKARAWTLRAVRALHDPVWTADGYVSDRWRPVSPVSGRLDAFQWQTPVAALPSAGGAVEPSPFEQAMLAASPERAVQVDEQHDAPQVAHDQATHESMEQDNAPASPPVADAVLAPSEPPAAISPAPAAVVASPPPAVTAPEAPARPAESTNRPAPLFRSRTDIPAGVARPAPAIPAIIPIVRPPDDPGVDDGTGPDEFAEGQPPVRGQEGGWRGFLSRMRG
jgi:HemY protein